MTVWVGLFDILSSLWEAVKSIQVQALIFWAFIFQNIGPVHIVVAINLQKPRTFMLIQFRSVDCLRIISVLKRGLLAVFVHVLVTEFLGLRKSQNFTQVSSIGVDKLLRSSHTEFCRY